MKKIVFGLVGLFIASLLLVSCGSENTMLSQFSKRKYLKKFKEKNVKYEDKVGELETEIAYEVKQEQVITASTEEQITPVQVKEEKTVEVATLTYQQQEQLAKVKTLANDYSSWNKYNRTTDFSMMNNKSELMLKNHSDMISNQQRASEILVAIFCVLIPFVGILIYEGNVTSNFWVGLLLTLIFWIPGIVFAFLVCFGGVSV